MAQLQCRLEYKSGLSYARLAAYQHQRAAHQSTAKHAVKLGVVHRDAAFLLNVDVAQMPRDASPGGDNGDG